MENRSLVVTVALAFVLVGLLSAPTHPGSVTGASSPSFPGSHASLMAFGHATLTTASPTPMTTYPRTVLVETFTGVWCPHCPAETQAFWDIDHHTNHNVISISELHVCGLAPPNPCLDNYVPPDNTSYTRGTFYSVCGYPDVFFDGQRDVCGASNSMPQMENEYNDSIANATSYPGNVSISEVAKVIPGNVTTQVNITSGISGCNNAVVYLMEYIGKTGVNNGGGPHNIGWVVRETLRNRPLTLTAGATTEINATGAIMPGWNALNLSVASFVQQNSTHIVENANMVPVTTETTAVQLNQTAATSGTQTKVTVQVANSSTGAPLSGATVNFTSDLGGSFTPAGGITASDGTFSTMFTAPNVSASQSASITATVTATNYTQGTGVAWLMINPIIPSSVPTGLTVTAADQQVVLNWTVPASGSSGVSYHLFRSTSQGGTYTPLGVAVTTSFIDSSVATGQSYWYRVDSHGPAGYSGNSTPVSATSVTASPQGLPAYAGWWFSIDSVNFTSLTNESYNLYLPATGLTYYSFGPGTYGFVASEPTGSLNVVGVPQTLTAVFSPLYATLEGTVSPASATVTVDGTALAVSNGAFLQLLAAGTYTLNVTATGYLPYSASVVLTAGNVTPETISLHLAPSASSGVTGSNDNGGLTTNELIIIIAVAAVIAVAGLLGGMMMMSSKGKRNPPNRNRGPGRQSPPETP